MFARLDRIYFDQPIGGELLAPQLANPFGIQEQPRARERIEWGSGANLTNAECLGAEVEEEIEPVWREESERRG
jgi:hypothetical protein